MNGIVGYEKAGFGVGLRELKLDDGLDVKKYKAVVREDNGKVLGIVGNNYKIVPHTQVLDAFNAVTMLEPKRVEVCKDGGVMFARYDIKVAGQLKMAEVKVGDAVSFGLRVFNSYDKSFGVGFELVANRLVCSNGLVMPKTMARLSLRHFDNVNIDRFSSLIHGRMEKIEPTVEKWREWMRIHPRKSVIESFVKGIRKENLGAEIREQLLERSLKANEEMGVWGIYNEFTHYTTHELKVRNVANRELLTRGKESALLGRFYTFNWN